ncbi:DUF6498-containing protein [Falsiroseomonas selenitidurans]|uniref:Permease n=1 Tax=Falsiroseomonas selenitidurans TaxID=2716335 RepID=A0ABX1DZQ7_9PROT|nr:DUF6498-containing protein [Falsiroseomonas selenitidurans]NKC30356.1 hypothetical protein [Falsiroseomonas selenitidurans]
MFTALRLPLAASTAALVLANLVPLGGALLGIWSSYELVLLFWAENLIIGGLQLLRMASALVLRQRFIMLFLIPFFTVHYGGFALGHGVFVATLMGPRGGSLADATALLLSPEGLLWACVALAASHALSFVVNFLGEGEWRRADDKGLMVEPYGRVVLLHLVIILGGMLSLALGEPTAILALLVVAKTLLDLKLHLKAHQAGPTPPA